MAIQADGTDLQLSEIQTEFGGSNPIGISEYYRGGDNVPSGVSDVPASGQILLSDFYGTANFSASGGTVTTYPGYEAHTFTSSS